MDWEEQKPGKRILVSEHKGTRLDSWNDACTFISTKAINPLHFGSRFRFQALQVTSLQVTVLYIRRKDFFHNVGNSPFEESLLNGN